MKLALLLLGLLATTSHALRLLKSGKEYEYQTTVTNSAGTMDVATHTSGEQYRMKVRVQVSGNTLNVAISNWEKSMYVGSHLPTENPYANTQFLPMSVAPVKFTVNLDSNGIFQSLVMPSGLAIPQKNIIKGWAAQLQISGANSALAFKSKEKSLHGDCEYSYAISPDMIVKSVSHMADCKNRVYKLVDQWKGFRCDIDYSDPQKKTSTDGLFSYANSVYLLGKNGGDTVIKGISVTSALVVNMFETPGYSHIAHVNVTSVLKDVRGSPGDISVSGSPITSLEYEFATDATHKWNQNRDLKAAEPLLSSGFTYDDDQATLKGTVLKLLAGVEQGLHSHGIDDATIQKNHRYGLQALYFPIYGMDYSTLKGLAEQLLADKTEAGVQKSNLFNEFLGNAGTTAAALVVRDLIMEGKFDNDRDATRILTAIPFHIRRPNVQLVQEYEKLLDFAGAERFLKMAIPLAFSHLVQQTCVRAGNVYGAEQKECFGTLSSKYVTLFWNKFKSASDRDEKILYLDALTNLRYGGQTEKVKGLLYDTNESPEYRLKALWSTFFDGLSKGGKDLYFPIFANLKDDHEVRISALSAIFWLKPSTTDMARILAVLKTDTDYEVINYAYTLFDKFANSINPCFHETAEKARFFLKYMKQYSQYETDWGFGVSKTYVREYQQKKYGYGGIYHYYVVGSHKSTTPLMVGLSVQTTFSHSYLSTGLFVSLRIEGLAKAVIRKFKTMDPGTWKTEDLAKILLTDMAIRERADQPVRVHINVEFKGVAVFSRAYDENSASQGGRLSEFFKGVSGLGNEYKINHQRALQVGAVLYEQPSELGMPMAYISSATIAGDLKATVKRGNARGLIYRNLDYDINVLGHAHAGVMISNPLRKVTFSIFQSRLYHIHVPRKIVAGVNPIRKEIKLSISRPPYDDPAMVLMHSQTIVTVKGSKLGQPVDELKKHCPGCNDRTVVSRGPGAAQSRVVRDYENEAMGYYNHMEYFDCEMDIRQGNTLGRAIAAFMPFNKNPKTLGSSLSLGVRQVVAYITMYPRAERCGIFTRWSQSETNPTTDFEISIRGSTKENGVRMFFRGRKTTIRILFKANGQPASRAYRASISIETAPASLKNRIKIQMNRAPVPALGIKPYTVCMAYESTYPDFVPEFFEYQAGKIQDVHGNAKLQYGEGTECDQGQGEFRVKFKHQTTAEAEVALKNKWYYNECMKAKHSPQWAARSGDKLPTTNPCYLTLYDATQARHYHWDVQFVKLTDRMKNIISNARAIIQAGLIPYYDEDPSATSSISGSDVGPFMNVDVVFKNGDKSADVKVETSQGTKEYKDYPLKLEWTKRLRNLRFSPTIKRLIDYKIMAPCVATVSTVQTLDNVTYPYQADSCWTLTSGHCGPNPVYAVFTKKVGDKLEIRAYFGGHLVEVSADGAVKINGAPKALTSGKEEVFKVGDTEILKLTKWGSTLNVYSFLKVWVATDNVFVQVMPAPSTRGQHCGLCGNFNRNVYDEWTGKDGQTIMTSPAALVQEWKWKC